MPLPAITTTQQVHVSIAPTDRRGKPAPVENVTWASSNEAVASVVADPGGLSALVVAQAPGDAVISVSADADLDPNVTSVIVGSETITVTQGTAVSVGIVPGAVEEQP